jgi:hypothetical protein
MVLRACYFCGSPGDVLDTYPVVPDRVASDRDDPERVVLCPDCHAKLERVLDDVLGAIDGTADVHGSSAATSASDETGISEEITFDTDPAGASPDDARDAGDDPADREGADGAPAPTEARDSTAATPGDSETEPADAAGEAGGGGAEPRDAADDGGAAAADPECDGEEPADAAREDETEARDDEDTDDAGTEESGDGGGSSGSLRGLGNSGTNEYRKALRLLQNREFPMPRSDLVDVMSSAYDLTREECDRLVDVAVERDWVVDDEGVLRRE